jgi:outer membrane protein OmpA-like peptidoglycan-associated protein
MHHKEGMHIKNDSIKNQNEEITDPNHKDFLHSKTASNHHNNQNKQSENTILDGSGSVNTNSVLDGNGITVNTNENSVLEGKPLSSLVIKGIDMQVQPLEEGMTYTINNILFASNSFELNDKTKSIVKEFSKFLNENPTITISIQGHTDDQGDVNKNIALSQNRANAVKEYLISLGIDSNRLEAIGYGSSKPKVTNDTEENRKMNRRTDFYIKKL